MGVVKTAAAVAGVPKANSLTVVILAIIGIVLAYSAVKGKDPRAVVKDALKKGQ